MHYIRNACVYINISTDIYIQCVCVYKCTGERKKGRAYTHPFKWIKQKYKSGEKTEKKVWKVLSFVFNIPFQTSDSFHSQHDWIKSAISTVCHWLSRQVDILM